MLRRVRISILSRSLAALGLALSLGAGLPQAAQAQAHATSSAKKPAATVAKKSTATKSTVAKSTPAKSRSTASRTTTAKTTVARAPVKSAAKSTVKSAAKSTPRTASKTQVARKAAPPTKGSIAKTVVAAAVAAPAASLSLGQSASLRSVHDPLALQASVALVVDQDTQEVLFRKNDQAVLPIASITKLMTGLLISEAGLDLTEEITITQDDVDTIKRSSSRLPVGTRLTRGELLQLALMSSENRAAHALARTHPEGMRRFVAMMNARAMMLGMKDTRYVEPTGLSSENRSSARDLAILVNAAYRDPMVSAMSVTPGHEVNIGSRVLQYLNSNRLVRSGDWDIGLQKTGYISEAGHCLVMQSRVAGRNVIMVLLDSGPGQSRLVDATRVRQWLEASVDHRDGRMQSAGVTLRGR